MLQIIRKQINPQIMLIAFPALKLKKGAMVVLTNKSRRVRFIKYWFPVIIYGILIFMVSAIPAKRMPMVFAYQDVVGHLLEYALFGLLWIRAFKEYYPRFGFNRRLLRIFIFLLIFAGLDELHQFFVPGRVASFSDVAVDMIGVLLANLLMV